MKNIDFKLSLIFGSIGLVAGALLGIFQISVITEEVTKKTIEQFGTVNALILIAAVQSAIFAFISSIIGLKISRKVGLGLNFHLDTKGIILAVIIGAVSALIISGADKFLFAQYLPEPTGEYRLSAVSLIATVLYGGVVEELMIRLFLMSLIVLLLTKIFAKSNMNASIPDWIYILSIFLSAILFAAGHLPATQKVLGLSIPIIMRAFLLNGLAGLGFGYLYWRKGLTYAMLSHMLVHIFNQLIFIPLFY